MISRGAFQPQQFCASMSLVLGAGILARCWLMTWLYLPDADWGVRAGPQSAARPSSSAGIVMATASRAPAKEVAQKDHAAFCAECTSASLQDEVKG